MTCRAVEPRYWDEYVCERPEGHTRYHKSKRSRVAVIWDDAASRFTTKTIRVSQAKALKVQAQYAEERKES
jgi:hypothetical protein